MEIVWALVLQVILASSAFGAEFSVPSPTSSTVVSSPEFETVQKEYFLAQRPEVLL